MSATDLPPAPQSFVDPDDDAPEPRTPLRRWLLATALAVPVAAAYGLVVLLVTRWMFADDVAGGAARGAFGAQPLLMLWSLAAGAALGGLVGIVREVLDLRAARREGREPALPYAAAPSWTWPALAAAAPIVSMGFAAAFVIAQAHFSDPKAGTTAGVFATLAGLWVTVFAMVGAVIVAVRSAKDEPDAVPEMDGIEGVWLQKAAAGAFWDIFVLIGAGCLVLAIAPVDLDATWALMVLGMVAMVDLPIRYGLLKRREERA